MKTNCIAWGHRGACGYEPENTLLSFKTAVEMGVDGIELDVHESKDGNIVVSHSDSIMIEGTRYRITKLTLDEIKAVRVEKNQEIPTLDEVFSEMEKIKGDLLYSIDLKDIRAAQDYNDVIVDNKVVDRVYTCLESRIFIKKLHRINPQLIKVYSTHVNGEGVIEDLAKVEKSLISVVNLPIDEITSEIVQAVHDKEILMFTWDVNEDDSFKKALQLDVDGIYSNYPDKLVKLLKKKTQ
ncbi:MAG: glycerophosphodiester phosphodiesterase [Promethearchaeota archaeon]